MATTTYYGLLLIAVLAYLPGPGQDLIYTVQQQSVPAKIIEIKESTIQYADPQSPGETKEIDRMKAALAFNASGDYIVFTAGNAASASSTKNFLNTKLKRPCDILITLDNRVLPAVIERENELEITYKGYKKNPGKAGEATVLISKFQIVLVIYKDGHHQFLANPTDIVSILSAAKKQVDELINGKNVNTKASNIQKKAEQPSISTGKPTTPSELVVTTAPSTAVLPSAKEGVPFDMEEYRDKAIRKVRELNEYMGDITNKTTSATDADQYVNLACDLFVNKGADSRIEVSKLGSATHTKYLIRVYLKKLQYTKYDKVKVTWARIQYVSQLREGKDGNYYGVVSFEQTFEGFVDGRVVYRDLTKKTAEVVVKRYAKQASGTTQELWDAFLADLSVQETQP